MLLILLLVPPAWGEPSLLRITFRTNPRGVQVQDYFGNSLGRSGEPLVVDLEKYGDPIKLTFKKEGYADVRREIRPYELQNGGSWPPDSEAPVTLPAVSLWARLRQSGGWVALGLGALAAWAVSRRRQPPSGRGAELEKLAVRRRQLGDEYIGALVGSYRITERIGKGGMAVVYRALPDENLQGEPVAVKVLLDEGDTAEDSIPFRREITSLRALSHPGIVGLIDWGEQNGALYLVMELVEGTTLRRCIHSGDLDPARALELMVGVFEAVDFAHRQGIVHRDLKPENLMLTPQGKVKVMDFGIARHIESTRHTRTGNAVGTPKYMAPEHIRGRDPHPSMDQYALGVITFEVLTGSPPFDSDDSMQIVLGHLNDPPPRLSSLRPDLPPELVAVVHRMLAKDPEGRFESLGRAAEALRQVLGNYPLAPPGEDEPTELVGAIERLVFDTEPEDPAV